MTVRYSEVRRFGFGGVFALPRSTFGRILSSQSMRKPLVGNWHRVGPVLVWLGSQSPFIRLRRPLHSRASPRILPAVLLLAGAGISAGGIAAHEPLVVVLGAVLVTGGVLIGR